MPQMSARNALSLLTAMRRLRGSASAAGVSSLLMRWVMRLALAACWLYVAMTEATCGVDECAEGQIKNVTQQKNLRNNDVWILFVAYLSHYILTQNGSINVFFIFLW
ncbi:MAG: hypothetical protein LBR89_00610 [Holosporales bacterium]|jgi:hypothetical protein|nr:hypothetical protein [Holosporales bacterium]